MGLIEGKTADNSKDETLGKCAEILFKVHFLPSKNIFKRNSLSTLRLWTEVDDEGV